ncbi:MAG TPA: RNA-binding S4 domain-containing protein [Azospira sp.]|nr:RNA-binding S4 domain-containing protein [Azospira sp.]
MSEQPYIPGLSVDGQLRLDKWLWAARFFKTRSLAQDAVDGGKVKVNGQAVKAAREVKAGDRLDIGVGQVLWTVTVEAVNGQRRPAPEARLLYSESAESVARRAREQEERALAPTPGQDGNGRPTKRDRRRMERFAG